MKKMITLLLGVAISFTSFAQSGKDTISKDNTADAVPAEYYCGMHPEITSDEPGKCPECQMELLQKKPSAKKPYTCSMHPDVASDKPGKCPKCGMQLVEKKIYTCPMHPDVISNKPGKCPKCGMTLVEKKKEARSSHQHQ